MGSFRTLFLQTFLLPLYLYPLRDSDHAYVDTFDGISQVYEVLFILFNSFCSPDLIISINLFLYWLILSSDCSNLLLGPSSEWAKIYITKFKLMWYTYWQTQCVFTKHLLFPPNTILTSFCFQCTEGQKRGWLETIPLNRKKFMRSEYHIIQKYRGQTTLPQKILCFVLKQFLKDFLY